MKRYIKICSIILISGILITEYGCEEKEEENKAPTCIILSPKNGDEFEKGDTVTISVWVEDLDGYISEVTYFINNISFGDVQCCPYECELNTEECATGICKIEVISKDNNGKTTSDTISISIIDSKPIPMFSCDQNEVYLYQAVYFEDQSTNNPTSWIWDFGENDIRYDQNPAYYYSSPGTYDVSLTVTNEYGSNTMTKTNFINVITRGEAGTVTDYDGNIYNTIKIGNQWWMAEDLYSKHYADGTEILAIEQNDPDFYGTGSIHGKYTWNTAMRGAVSSDNNPSGIQGVCPDNWHIPSDAEWKQLEMHLGMSQEDADTFDVIRGTNEGSKLAGIKTRWNDGLLTSNEAFGTSGFNASPTYYYYPAQFRGFYVGYEVGYDGNAYYWSATTPVIRTIHYNSSSVSRTYKSSAYMYSVRCVKDD